MSRELVGRFVLATLAIAIVVHSATIAIMPRHEMGTRIAAPGVRFNVFARQARVGADRRTAPRPDGEMAVSTCVFDLAEGPLRIELARTAGYASLSLYSDNSDNFYTTSDRESANGRVDIVLIREGQPHPDRAPALVVESPTRQGIAIARRIAPDLSAFQAIDRERRADTCGRYVPPPPP